MTTQQRVHKAVHPALNAGLAPEAAMRLVVASCIRQFEFNARAARVSSDPELVHQMRVALRRLRCALRFFDDTAARQLRKALDPGLRELARALGEQRDWDVFLTGMLPALGLSAPVRARALRLRRAARAHARAAAASPVCADLKRWQADWPVTSGSDLHTPRLDEYARQRLSALQRRVAQGAKKFDRMGKGAHHRLRINLKSLRYAVDMTAGLFDAAQVKPFVKVVAHVQDWLGELVDLQVARRLLGKLDVPDTAGTLAKQRLKRREADVLAAAAARLAGMRAAAAFWKP